MARGRRADGNKMATRSASTDSGPNEMKRVSAFLDDVRDALGSLYDLPYLQSHRLARHLPSESGSGSNARGRMLQSRLLEAIEQLRPELESGAVGRRAVRRYDLIRLRYGEGLEIQEVCQRLGIGRSEYFR